MLSRECMYVAYFYVHEYVMYPHVKAKGAIVTAEEAKFYPRCDLFVQRYHTYTE